MRRWLSPVAFHWLALFAIMGAAAAVFAWNTLDLVQVAMANYRLLRDFGAMAVADGGLAQLASIIIRGVVSLASYLLFKACEVELVSRWRSR